MNLVGSVAQTKQKFCLMLNHPDPDQAQTNDEWMNSVNASHSFLCLTINSLFLNPVSFMCES